MHLGHIYMRLYWAKQLKGGGKICYYHQQNNRLPHGNCQNIRCAVQSYNNSSRSKYRGREDLTDRAWDKAKKKRKRTGGLRRKTAHNIKCMWIPSPLQGKVPAAHPLDPWSPGKDWGANTDRHEWNKQQRWCLICWRICCTHNSMRKHWPISNWLMMVCWRSVWGSMGRFILAVNDVEARWLPCISCGRDSSVWCNADVKN